MKKKQKRNKWKREYKFVCIVKIGGEQFAKYGTLFPIRNLKKFADFLDKKFDSWRWFNVYDRQSKLQIGNFTNKNKPTKAGI